MPWARGSLQQNGCSPIAIGAVLGSTDETIMAYLSYPEGTTNPWLSEPVTVDGVRFRALLDEYYDLRGWDRPRARPSARLCRAWGWMEFTPVLNTVTDARL